MYKRQTQYKEQIMPALMKEFGYSSVMQCPKLTKIVINQGMGQAVADKKLIDVAEAELTQIAGQKAVQTRSRKDISNFKLRKGMPIGVRVTPVSYTHLPIRSRPTSCSQPSARPRSPCRSSRCSAVRRSTTRACRSCSTT